jgi:Putative Ig domain
MSTTRQTILSLLKCVAAFGLVFGVPQLSAEQSDVPELAIKTTELPKAFVRQPYQARLEGTGGISPRKWEISAGSLPAGLDLHSGGSLTGTPTQRGDFHFTVTVSDSETPARQISRQFILTVVSPLATQWGRYPKVNGERLEGSILASNETDEDVDLTVIVLAVNETGRAVAIGYQHLLLKKSQQPIEIPFGDNLPDGTYQLNVDAIAEASATNSIYRARLVPKERFVVQSNP